MRIIGRLLSLLLGGLIVSLVVGAIAALQAKRRIVPSAAAEADEVDWRPSSSRSTSTAPPRRSAAAISTAGTAAGSSTFATRSSIRPAHGFASAPCSAAGRSWSPRRGG